MNPLFISFGALGLLGVIGAYFMTEDFWNVYYLKKGWYRCVFRGANKRMKVVWLKPDPLETTGKEIVHYRKGTYTINPDALVTTGNFNVPTHYFIEGVVRSIKLDDPDSGISSQEVEAMRKWHIFTDIMNAIDVQPISQTMQMFIICGLMVAGFAAVYYLLGNRIDDAVLPLIQPTPVLGTAGAIQ